MHKKFTFVGMLAGSAALALSLGCAAPPPPSDPAPSPAEDVAAAAEALTVGDWSLFPDGFQCMVAVEVFYKAKFNVHVPLPANSWDGPCAPLGACHIWVDSIPDGAIWDRIPNDGAHEPTTYDMIVYPPVNGDPYGHIASVDHVSNGTIYVMDDNYCLNNCQRKAAAPHPVNWAAYGWYHLKSLAPPPPVCVPSPEVCNNKDDNCNGLVDENLVQQCGSNVGECRFGAQTCAAGAWGACTGGVGPTVEICDGLDNDCDGLVDDHDVCELDEASEAALLDLGPSTDVDGDGRADACALSAAGIVCQLSGEHGPGPALPAVPLGVADPPPASVFSTLRLGDLDGDGRADACVREPQGVVCWLSDGHGFGRRLLGPALSDDAGWADEAYAGTIRLADVDGDGRADLCARGVDGLTCYRSTGNGFVPMPALAALSDAAGFHDVNHFATLRMGDLDGDGRANVCAREAGGMGCWLSGKHGFGARVVGPPWSDAAGWGAWQRWSTIRMADVDGDGRADLCAREPQGFRCYLFDGKSFGYQVVGPTLDDASGWSSRDRFGSLRLGDLDGDGAADLCARGAGGVTCWLWTGHGFDRRIPGPALTDADGWNRPDRYRTLRLADVSGDGRADLCGRGAGGVECWLSEGGGFGGPVAGPSWSDQAGWKAAPRFESIRIAGAGPEPGSGTGAGTGTAPGTAMGTGKAPGASHGPGAAAAKLADGAPGGSPSSCSAGPAGSRGPGAALVTLMGLGLALRRRARRPASPGTEK